MFTLIKRSGGVDSSDANAGAYQILIGYSGYVDDEKIDGTMPNRGAINYSLPVQGSYIIPDGWHSGSGKVTQSLSTQAGATITPGKSNKLLCGSNKWTTGDIWVQGDTDLVAGNIKNGVNLFGVNGTYKGCVTTDANIGAYQILTGYSAYGSAGTKIEGTMPNRGTVNHSLSAQGTYTIPDGWHSGSGKVTQSLSTQGGSTTTPTTVNKLLCGSNKWTTGDIWIKGDSNLVAGNIKNGVNLFGVTGTYSGCVTSDGNVGAAQILTGYSAYGSGGSLIDGTMPNRGTVNHSLSAQGTYTIPDGWHSGSGKITQSLSTQGGSTVTPGTGNILLCSSNKWVTGDIWVNGDSNLKAENIRKGVSIFGITGNYDPVPPPPSNPFEGLSRGDGVILIDDNGEPTNVVPTEIYTYRFNNNSATTTSNYRSGDKMYLIDRYWGIGWKFDMSKAKDAGLVWDFEFNIGEFMYNNDVLNDTMSKYTWYCDNGGGIPYSRRIWNIANSMMCSLSSNNHKPNMYCCWSESSVSDRKPISFTQRRCTAICVEYE